MKLNLILPALAAILGLTLASAPAYGQTTTTTAPTNTPATTTEPGTPTAPVAPAAKKISYKGTITAIDTTAQTITVKSTKKTITLTIAATTTYKGGKALSDFAVGDKVSGSYTVDASGTMTAASLHKKKS